MRFILSGLLILATVQTANAFDQNRKGFILGVGVGAAVAQYSMDITSAGSPDRTVDDSEFGVGVRGMRLGFGANEQFLLYLDGATAHTSHMWNSVAGAGFSGYFNKTAPSMYVTGLVGIASVEPDGQNTHHGLGVAAGVGWEFATHYSVEFTVGWNHADREEKSGLQVFNDAGPALDTDTWTLLFTLHGMAY